MTMNKLNMTIGKLNIKMKGAFKTASLKTMMLKYRDHREQANR